jgi:hypothetical protein
VLTNKTQPLPSADSLDDASGLVDAERRTLPFSPHDAQAPSLDAELLADFFHLARGRPEISGQVHSVDAYGFRAPVIHNAFFVPGKVPSLNELLDAKGGTAPRVQSIIMRHLPKKGKGRGARFDAYNDLKQDWKHRTIKAIGAPFVRVNAAFFGYVVVEQAQTRDPSNIGASAIKFIEDGIVAAGVMPNDGWKQVLGIRVHWVCRPTRDPGIYVVMSDCRLIEEELEREYEEDYLTRVF